VVGTKARRALLVGALAAGTAALALALAWKPSPRVPVAPATGYRVIVLAVDGLDGQLVTQFAQRGGLPGVSRVLRRATTALITADEPPLPLVGWTTLATGRPLDDDARRAVAGPGGGSLFGLSPAVTGAVRAAGGRTVTVGWPGTWPVGRRAAGVAAPYLPASASRDAALPPALFADAPGQTDPALEGVVRDAVVQAEAALDAVFAGMLGGSPRRPDAAWDEAVAGLRWSLLADMTTVEVAADLITREEPHLALVYLGGLDAVSRRFLPAAASAASGTEAPGADAHAGVVGAYHLFIDAAVERFRSLCDERTFLVVCSVYGARPPGLGDASLGSVAAPPGVFILHGRDAHSTPVPLQMTTLDVAPTLLALVGVPVPEDMSGRVVAEMLPQGLLGRVPVSRAKAAGRAARAAVSRPALADRLDALVSERLREMEAATRARP